MPDIVERLRNYDYRGNRPPEHAVMGEAAVEIERLRALVPDTGWQNFWVFVEGEDGRPESSEAVMGDNGWEHADTGELLQVAVRRRPVGSDDEQ